MSAPRKRTRAPRRQPDAGDHLEQRRLAGAVDAEQGDHLAVVDGEVDAEQHLQLPVGEVDRPAREHRQVATGGSEVADLLVLDDLVDHAVEVAVDEPAGRSRAAATPRTPGISEGDHRAGDAEAAVDAGEEQRAEDAADTAEEDAGEGAGVRAALRRDDGEERCRSAPARARSRAPTTR